MSFTKFSVKSVSLIVLLSMLAVLIVGCTPAATQAPAEPPKEKATDVPPVAPTEKEEVAPTQAAPAEKALTPINLRLSWKYKGEYAHLFAARELGYFKDEGLDVNILEGSDKANPVQLLVQGEDQFAYLDPTKTIPAIHQGMDLLIVGTFVQKMPVGVATKASVKNDGPQDMVGKKIVDTAASTGSLIMEPFLKLNNIDPASVELIIADGGAKTSMFLNDQVQMMSGYVTNDFPVLEVTQGVDLNYWLFADYGYNMLMHGILGSREYIEKNPEITAGLVRAVQRGSKWAHDNPAEAAKMMHNLFPDILPEDLTVAMWNEALKMFFTENSKGQPYGWQSEKDWEDTIEKLYSTGVIKERFDDVNKYFTNDYIDMSIK
ncbi:MAG: ABC transporter substrate-binding protein [Anaerolineaceae bacterium]|nr:ABC transporter substrate-binding protein [Anaerolineaceae bacterium]